MEQIIQNPLETEHDYISWRFHSSEAFESPRYMAAEKSGTATGQDSKGMVKLPLFLRTTQERENAAHIFNFGTKHKMEVSFTHQITYLFRSPAM
jgi:hypothetical protein